MKNFLILGLTALLLFSISAALSLWLNQGRTPETSPSTEKSAKKTSKESSEKEEANSKNEKKQEGSLGGASPESLSILNSERQRLNLRTDEMNLVMKDMIAVREAVDNLTRQLMTDLKTAESKVGDQDVRTAEMEKKKLDFDTAERKNIDRISGLMDAMSPESAASTLKQMAESGKLEVAAKVLAGMKDRNAARALGELADPALAAQLLEKMRLLKGASTPSSPRPAGATPAGGVPAPKSPQP